MNLRKNLRGKPLLIEDQEINRKLEESKKNERDEILNLDILYECLSPPSDLNGEYEITTKITKSNLSKWIF